MRAFVPSPSGNSASSAPGTNGKKLAALRKRWGKSACNQRRSICKPWKRQRIALARGLLSAEHPFMNLTTCFRVLSLQGDKQH